MVVYIITAFDIGRGTNKGPYSWIQTMLTVVSRAQTQLPTWTAKYYVVRLHL